jgi:CheY-like chemotaxis protein/cold shock CspA family protein
MSRSQGRVKWFNDQNGFGIICGPDGRNVIVHQSAIVVGGDRRLKEGDVVEYECELGAYGPTAANVNVQPLPGRASDGAPGRPAAASKAMILIVEDDHDLRAALSRLLQVEGYGIQMASDVPEALEHVAQRAPDAAVIDIHLPHENGLILARMLRNRFGTTLPIVILSADAEMDTLREVALTDVAHYLHKPVSATALAACLSSVLRSAGR